MTRPIQATLQLTLNVAPDISRDELKQSISSQIRRAIANTLSDSPDAIQWIAIHDPECRLLTQQPHLDSILTNFGITAAVWCVEDVLEIRPDLTHEQAAAVLDAVIAKHDASCGIGWDTLEQFAEMLYGEAPDFEE